MRPLFGPVAVYSNAYRYDVSAEGQRFLVVLPEKKQTSTATVTVVQNWQAGLKKEARMVIGWVVWPKNSYRMRR